MAESLNELIDRVLGTRARLSSLNKEVDLLKETLAAEEKAIMDRLDQEGMTSVAGKNARVHISNRESFRIEDLHDFQQYVVETNQPWLFQARIASRAMQEAMQEENGNIPGVTTFTQRTLNVRKERKK